MRNFIIKSSHSVYADSYEKGEGNYVNSYELNAEIKAETPKEAIVKYFENHLFYDFSFNLASQNERGNLEFSTLVDAENSEIKQGEKKYNEWVDGAKTLYSNNIEIEIYEMVKVDIGLDDL